MNTKSKFFIVVVILYAFLAISCVSANDNQTEMIADGNYHSFEELNQIISESNGELNLTQDYNYDDGTIRIEKDNEFIINGNGHTIEGIDNSDDAFIFDSEDTIIINNLTFKDCINTRLKVMSSVVFNDVTFANCSCYDDGAFFDVIYSKEVIFNNCIFQMNNGKYKVIENGDENSIMTINNSLFSGGIIEHGIITIGRSKLCIENTTFENISSRLATAINFKGCNLTIKKSKFLNLHARLTGGAIIAKFFPRDDGENPGYLPYNPFLIEDCEFRDITSTNDGTIFFDLDSGADYMIQTLNISNTSFSNCKSTYGGALVSIGGVLNVVNSSFINNSAGFEGGAIYTSWSDVNLINTNLFNNSAANNAGAIYFDKGKLTIKKSNLIGNSISKNSPHSANAIYAHDVDADFSNSTFDNGGVSVYADFASNSKLENITKNNDIFLMDNNDYIVCVESKGIKLNITNNSIVVDELPSRFDSCDLGWVTPFKLQGDNDDCWAFATASSLESSLLKSTGVDYNLSQNYVQDLQLKYARNGDLRISLTGFSYSGLGYALSWLGALRVDNEYDDRCMVKDTDFNDARIHLQDAMIIFTERSDSVDLIKQAIMKYGAVTAQLFYLGQPDYLNSTGENIAVMDHCTHLISLIGWDDNLVAEGSDNPGAWISKDSMLGYSYYPYDFSGLFESDHYALVPQNAAIAYIFENDIDYHMNYQTDLTALCGFDGNYTYYSNEFTSKYSELIGAVGTYFNGSGINYSFDIYVNGEKVHSQDGISEFAGFRTIVLSRYIPVKEGDTFKVVFRNNALPYQAFSRQHYLANMSLISKDGKSWEDITLENRTVCLKVYTVADDTRIINNADIAVDYAGGKYFSVNVVTADGHKVGSGVSVKFNIGGKTTTVKTNADGIAKIKITQTPKKYTIKTTYKGKTLKNTLTVKQVLKASKVTLKKTAKKFTLKAKLKINGKLVKGKKITFKLNGKTYKVKTNSKGIAQKTLKKNVINKLKKGKTYTVKVTYLKDTIKTTVKVK